MYHILYFTQRNNQQNYKHMRKHKNEARWNIMMGNFIETQYLLLLRQYMYIFSFSRIKRKYLFHNMLYFDLYITS